MTEGAQSVTEPMIAVLDVMHRLAAIQFSAYRCTKPHVGEEIVWIIDRGRRGRVRAKAYVARLDDASEVDDDGQWNRLWRSYRIGKLLRANRNLLADLVPGPAPGCLVRVRLLDTPREDGSYLSIGCENLEQRFTFSLGDHHTPLRARTLLTAIDRARSALDEDRDLMGVGLRMRHNQPADVTAFEVRRSSELPDLSADSWTYLDRSGISFAATHADVRCLLAEVGVAAQMMAKLRS